jgi:hypothetical protein
VFERPPITSRLLFLTLTCLLLVSGSLQCALNLLPYPENNYRPAVRVDACHLVLPHPAPAVSCPSKTCHRENQPDRNLGGPEYHSQRQQGYPLASSAPPVFPECKSGAPFQAAYPDEQPLLARHAALALTPFQSLRELRTTVLLN